MTKLYRLLLFVFLGAFLGVVYWKFKGVLVPTDPVDLYIFTALLSLSFVVLIVEHYFTKPADVLSASIAILLLITPIQSQLDRFGVWFHILFFYSLTMGALAVVSLALVTTEKPDDHWQNKLASFLKFLAVHVGNGRYQFFITFLLGLLFYVDNKSTFFLLLFGFAGFVLIDPWRIILWSISHFSSTKTKGVGRVFGVQSKFLFLVKVFQDAEAINIFDFVAFRNGMVDQTTIQKGLVLEKCFLNAELWIKVLVTDEINDLFSDDFGLKQSEENLVYKIANPNQKEYLSKFIGTVYENSDISKIRFIYNTIVEIAEGQLLEVTVGGRKIIYQTVQGTTKIEPLEHKNEAGFVLGEAVQLGIWDQEEGRFDKYGWVPVINSPVHVPSGIAPVVAEENEYTIGNLPNSSYPVILNKDVAITHHTAVLGITGTGKSTFARNLIRQYLSDPNVKVICVDFTSEYSRLLSDLNPVPTIETTTSNECFDLINKLEREQSRGFKADEEAIEGFKKPLWNKMRDSIKKFVDGDDQISIFELPEVSNSSGVLLYTKIMFQALFYVVKAAGLSEKKICIVLEEAQTVVPEWNFVGVTDQSSKPLLNSIAQIALQGRKYNVGLLVIAQRTANVSKTILTQCNTIISFQEFDKTSSDFLSNYFGASIAETLPNLKFRQAVAAGKALRSNVPMIFEVPVIEEQVADLAIPDQMG